MLFARVMQLALQSVVSILVDALVVTVDVLLYSNHNDDTDGETNNDTANERIEEGLPVGVHGVLQYVEGISTFCGMSYHVCMLYVN